MKTMKRILALTLTMTLFVSVCAVQTFAAESTQGVAITEENFPDENFRNYMLNGYYNVWDDKGNCTTVVFDANQDGYLSDSELANIKTIQIQQSPITDLKGIEHLTSLVEIGCQFSAVEKMDLSNNKELVYLMGHRANLQGELDLSNCAKLFSATLNRNPNLTSLNLNGCESLDFLDISSTGVKELDISNCPKLTGLAFSATEISQVDTSNNKKLKNVSAYNSGLTSLDLSNNPELEYLDVSNCKLSSLDVSTQKNLYTLNVTFNNLAWLNVGNNENLDAHISDSTILLQVSEPSFDITEAFKGIDPEKITIVSGAQIDGSIISSYSYDTPIVYTYDCGTCADGALTLTVTLNLTK